MCGDDDRPRPSFVTVCGDERSNMWMCHYDGPPKGIPDMTADCTAYCANLKGLSCAPSSDDCKAQCLSLIKDGIGTDKSCTGAFAAYIHCAATKMTSNDFECKDGSIDTTGDACDFPGENMVDCRNYYSQD